MRKILLQLTLSDVDEYEYQDTSTLLVVEDFVLRHLPEMTDIQIISDSIDKKDEPIDIEKIMSQWDSMRKRIAEGDKSDAPTVWFGSVIDTFLEKLESCPPEFQQVIQDDFWNIVE